MDMPARPVFEGIWLPMVTPMRAGHVDCEAAQALARYYRNAGIAGLVLFGSTGEGNLLSLPEKIDMIEAIRTDPHALPLVFGAGGVDTRDVAAAIRRLDKLSPAGYLVPPPYYLCPSQQGILWHYRQIAWATERPVILYNIPKRAGVAMTVETMETLAALPQFGSVKECNPHCCPRSTRAAGWTSCAARTWPSWITSRWEVAAPFRRGAPVSRALRRGHAAGARRPRRSSARAVRTAARPDPAVVRRTQSGADQARAGLQGLITDELRPPMTSASRELSARLQRAMSVVQCSPSRLQTA